MLVSVAETLGAVREPDAVQGLIELLNHKSYLVRRIAAIALGSIGDAGALTALTEALDDEEEYVRRAARHALKKITEG